MTQPLHKTETRREQVTKPKAKHVNAYIEIQRITLQYPRPLFMRFNSTCFCILNVPILKGKKGRSGKELLVFVLFDIV